MARSPLTAQQPLPVALEAEQALLGALLFDNSAFALLPPALGAEHFGEPFHMRLYRRIAGALERGQPIDPAMLMESFAGDPAAEGLGGIRYLADLIDRAPPGANAPSYAKVILDTSVRRGLVQMGRDLEERARDPDILPQELLTEVDAVMSDLRSADTEIKVVDSDDALDGVIDYLDNPGAHDSGITTGLEPLDKHLGPMMGGDLWGLGGRPGAGKSAIAGIVSRNVAWAKDADDRYYQGVLEIHAEMSVQQAWRRRLTATAFEMFQEQAPAYSSIRKRTVEYAQMEVLRRARERLRGIPLRAVKRTGMTLGRIRALALRQRALWARQGIRLALLVIDHAGLITTDREHRSRVDQQTEVSNGLKELAGDLDIPILVLLQLSRQVESRDDKRPTLSDFRDSGSWEQDLDVAMGAYRESYYAVREKEPVTGTAKADADWANWDQRCRSPWIDIGLLKVREGDTGNARLWADMKTNTILGAPPADNFFGGL